VVSRCYRLIASMTQFYVSLPAPVVSGAVTPTSLVQTDKATGNYYDKRPART
jgi:hypothetical protein